MKRRPLRHVYGLFMLLACLLAGGVRVQEPLAPRQAELSALPTGSEWQHQESYISVPASVWRIETVDSNGVGSYNSLALDASGWPHISYYDFTNHDLKYAYKDASGWHIETVDSTGRVGAYTSLALDSASHPHISYCSRTDDYAIICNDLKYAWRDETAWHIEWLDTIGNVGGYTSLALDDDQPHISYYDFTNGDLKYAYKDASGSLHVETVDGIGADVGMFTSLAIAWEYRHISYFDNTNKDLKYAHAHSDDYIWNVWRLDSSGDVGYYTSLALCHYNPTSPDPPPAPRITYRGNFGLKYAHKQIYGGWLIPVTLGSDSPGPTSLALDSNCERHISYFELSNGDLRYFSDYVSGWRIETVDDDGDVWPYWSSLALDSSGLPHISYYDDSHFGLSYAYKVHGVYLPIVLRNAQ